MNEYCFKAKTYGEEENKIRKYQGKRFQLRNSSRKAKKLDITTFENQDKDTKNPILIRMQQIK